MAGQHLRDASCLTFRCMSRWKHAAAGCKDATSLTQQPILPQRPSLLLHPVPPLSDTMYNLTKGDCTRRLENGCGRVQCCSKPYAALKLPTAAESAATALGFSRARSSSRERSVGSQQWRMQRALVSRGGSIQVIYLAHSMYTAPKQASRLQGIPKKLRHAKLQ